ncbi:MAG: diguanylate cyclase [Proteobacteria bacterium]|nr:diguanylate cyclase [Pseudomonadota bacterium]
MGAITNGFPLSGKLPKLAGFALLIAVTGWWSIHHAVGPAGFSMLWVPSGLLFGMLLTSPRSDWLALVVAAFLGGMAANLTRNGIGYYSFALNLCNVFDAWFAARIVRAKVADVAQLATINRTLAIAFLAVVIAGATSALGATLAHLVLLHQTHELLRPFTTWFGSHALGMVIFGALTVVVRIEGLRMLGLPQRRLELALSVSLLGVAAGLIFSQQQLPGAFLLIPALLLCVLRHRFSGFVPAMALIALISTTATASGNGPLAAGTDEVSEAARALVLQLFILSCCVTAFPVASVLTERRVLARRLMKRDQHYRLLADNSRDLILRILPCNAFDYVSPAVTELLGLTQDEFERTFWERVHPEDVEALRELLKPLHASEGIADVEYRCRHQQGHYIWLSANVRSVRDEDGGNLSLIFSARDVSARIEAEQALARQARRDPLTGLGNRLLFNERMALAMDRASRNGSRVGLLYFDVDHFKTVNDTHGHAAGDHVLCVFARRIETCVRSVDLAVRLGGDEFAVLVEDVASASALESIADKILLAMRAPVLFDSTPLHITTSIGIGMTGAEPMDAEALLHLADAALYEAKAAGRNGWRLKGA